jgi:hypothetical protein
MKRLFLCLFLCSTCFGQWQNSTKPILGTQIQNWPQGLVGYWLMNENSGNLVNDLSGNGNTSTITGATWVGGKFGPCVNFDGATDYVTIPASSVFDLSKGGSFGAWVYGTSAMISTAKVIIAQGTWESSWGLGYYSTDTEIRLRLGNDGPVFVKNITDGWHHLFGTFDGATARLYVDGKLVSSKARTLTANTGAVYIGGNVTGRWFAGQIDNVQIFNCALTAGEVARLYHDPFWIFRDERPELYVTTGAPPAGTQPGNILESPVFHSPVIGASLGLGGLILICGCARRRSPKL